MELGSRILAEVEVGDPDPEVPGPSPLVTDGSAETIPNPGPTLSSISEVAGAVTLRTPIAEFPQMLGTIGAVDNPDVYAEYVTLRWRRAPRLGPLSLLILSGLQMRKT